MLRSLVVRAPRNDDVSKLLGGDAELLKGGLDELYVLVQHLYIYCTVLYCTVMYCMSLLHVSPQLVHVLQHALSQPAVRVSVDKQLHVEQITDLRITISH